jgi:hypothetical protein
MSIKSSALRLCGYVRVSSERDRVRCLLLGIDRLPDEASGASDRSSFGYLARQLHVQILGYLVVNERSESLTPLMRLSQSPPLSDGERRELESVHAWIRRLNDMCLEPLTARLPECAKAVDPYSSYPYSMPADTVPARIVSEDAMAAVADAFHQHPAIRIAIEDLGSVVDNIQESTCHEVVRSWTESILRAGLAGPPRELDRLATLEPASSSRRLVARRVAALVCLRASIAVLDQLVYQTLVSDRLPLLNEDNIIVVKSRTSHLTGTGITLVYQPNERADVLADLLAVVLVRSRPARIPRAISCSLEAMRYEASEEYGETVEIGLREFDDNLNPFSPLIQHL